MPPAESGGIASARHLVSEIQPKKLRRKQKPRGSLKASRRVDRPKIGLIEGVPGAAEDVTHFVTHEFFHTGAGRGKILARIEFLRAFE